MAKKPCVLIVDDEQDFVEPMSFWMEAKGYPVKKAENGLQAIEVIKAEPPDVVFLDLNMPEMGGIETLRRIRAINKTMPVIMVTAAHQDKAMFAEAKSLGIAGFFRKTESMEWLGKILDAALKRLPLPEHPAA